MMVLPLALALAVIQVPDAALRVVVLEGEDAVNVIQQKTAVRPLIEVRDRNNLPVAGATVTFTIGGGQPAAFAGGLQTLSVTTNAAGQAAATGFNVIGPGTVQVQVQAAFQGQVATAAISQTNVATAAAAAQAGGGTGSGASAGGGAAGGGGGLSTTTVAIAGAAVAGGAAVAIKVAGGGDDGGSGDRGQGFDLYRGTFAGQMVFSTTFTNSTTNNQSSCIYTRSLSGTLTIELHTDLRTGTARFEGSMTDLTVSGPGCTLVTSPNTFTEPNASATGGPSALSFSTERGGTGLSTKVTFTGSHANNAITGTMTIAQTMNATAANGTNVGSGSTTVSITLPRITGS